MRLSIPGRIFAAFAALVVVFGAISGYTAWEVARVSAQVAQVHRTLLPLPPVFAEIKSELRGLDLALEPREAGLLRRSVHLARRVHPYLERLETSFAEARGRLEGATPLAGGEGELLARRWSALDAERASLAVRITAFFDRIEAETDPSTEPHPQDGEPERIGVARTLRRAIGEVGREVARVELEVQGATQRAMDAFAQEERAAVLSAVLLTGLGLALGAVLTAVTALTLRPLRILREGVERIARGDYERPVDINRMGQNELGALAVDINRMAEAIRNRDAQLARQQTDLLHQERLATVGRMAAQITHELRNPLSSIGLNSELLMEELDDEGDESARALLTSIIQEVERLREITEAYLSFARLPRPEPVPVDLNALAAETLDFVRTEMERASVRARLDGDRAARPVLVDPHQIRAGLLNLLRNAREALAPGGGGHIVLKVRTLGDEATLEVVDDGPGFTADARAHLFEPFFTTKTQGTGLGLSYVRKLLEAQGGRVEIDDAPGGGALVRMHLPLTSAEEWS
jgi:two-component system NtrC family sensor kinase